MTPSHRPVGAPATRRAMDWALAPTRALNRALNRALHQAGPLALTLALKVSAGLVAFHAPASAAPPAATTVASGAPMFADTTYAELRPYAATDRLVAVVRCEAIETLMPGSRSERQQAKVTVLAADTGAAPGGTVELTRFAQGAPLMSRGQVYLVAAYRDARDGPWALVEARAATPEAAAGTLQAAQAELARRLGR